ncbi:MAG TPA: right-handed parallel beta-helix repeat-containing protein [Albitalea sp.]|uniref:right-handed parallel beta-helix repeat-containing protein n=1 Tax=Piscinibacter sp. TaxID=1903157 RepID=UPI002ED12EA6
MSVFHRVSAALFSCAAVLLLALPQVASAQATRTWVSGVGDDANPCSRTAPCKTFAGAISKTAANGEINCIDSGGFGTVTVTKSIIIDCKGVLAGVLNAGTGGVIINIAGGQVTLRNLDIQGAGTGTVGVRVLAAAAVQLDEVVIRGQSGSGLEVVPSANTHVTVSRSLIRDNAAHGILVNPSGGVSRVSVAHTTLAANALTGLRANDNSSVDISDTVLTGNGTHGATAASAGGPVNITLERTVSSANGNGGVLVSGGGAVMWLSNTLLMGNAYGFYPAVGGGQYLSFGNNRSVGNSTSNGTPTGGVVPML